MDRSQLVRYISYIIDNSITTIAGDTINPSTLVVKRLLRGKSVLPGSQPPSFHANPLLKHPLGTDLQSDYSIGAQTCSQKDFSLPSIFAGKVISRDREHSKESSTYGSQSTDLYPVLRILFRMFTSRTVRASVDIKRGNKTMK